MFLLQQVDLYHFNCSSYTADTISDKKSPLPPTNQPRLSLWRSRLQTKCVELLTWNCLMAGLRHLLAGMTCTFMIWIECARARWRAPISRSETHKVISCFIYVSMTTSSWTSADGCLSNGYKCSIFKSLDCYTALILLTIHQQEAPLDAAASIQASCWYSWKNIRFHFKLQQAGRLTNESRAALGFYKKDKDMNYRLFLENSAHVKLSSNLFLHHLLYPSKINCSPELEYYYNNCFVFSCEVK